MAAAAAAAVPAGAKVWFTRTTADRDFRFSSGRRREYLDLMADTSTCIVHGDRDQLPAFITSRPLTRVGEAVGEHSGAESDAFLYPRGTPASRVRALANAFSWSDLAEWGKGLTHRPVAVEITLAGAAAVQAVDGTVQQPVPGAPYRDPRWPAMASRVDAVCAAVKGQLERAASTDAAYEALVQGLRRAASDTFAPHRPPGAGPYYTGAAAQPSARSGLRAAAAVAKRLRRREGKPLPPAQVQLLAQASRLQHRILSHALTAQDEAAVRERARLTLERRALLRQHRRWNRANVKGAYEEAERFLSQARVMDPHALFKRIGVIAPEDPDSFSSSNAIPDMPGKPPALQRFTDEQSALRLEQRGEAPLPGLSKPGFAEHVPVETRAGAGGIIGRHMTAWEVLLALYPMHPQLLVHTAGQCPHGCSAHGPCALWDDFVPRLQAAAGADRVHDPDCPMPAWRACVKTATGAGTDGLKVDTLRFAAPEQWGERLPHRLRVCNTLATMFNTWLDVGKVPTSADFRRGVITPLPKDGLGFDAADPDCYRGITSGNLIPKVFSLVLMSRMQHWAVNNGLVAAEQVGFMPMHGAEMHVMTLRETIRLRKVAGADTFVLFVDLKKAYDNVHLPTLWRLLEHAGVPTGVVGLLREWDASRRAAIRVNGKLSPDFLTNKGLPQGDVLSPLLFNLYIESLSRMLRSLPGFRGVSVATAPGKEAVARANLAAAGLPEELSFHLTHLLYADDLAILADSPEQLQLALSAVDDWGREWGLDMGLARGKTEAVPFRAADEAPDRGATLSQQAAAAAAGAAAALEGLQPLHTRAGPVQWRASYKYLGIPMLHSLDAHGFISQWTGRLQGLYRRYFRGNRLISSLPATLQLQLASTILSGAVTYLMSVMPVRPADVAPLDVIMRSTVRSIMRLPPSMPDFLVDAERRTLPFYATAMKHHARLYHYLRLTPFRDGLAAKLTRFLEYGEPQQHHSHWSANWVVWTKRAIAEHTRAPPPQRAHAHGFNGREAQPMVIDSLRDIGRETSVFARAVAHHSWANARTVGLEEGGGVSALFVSSGVRVRAGKPRTHASDLYGGKLRTPYDALGTTSYATPLSVTGPACSGGLLGNVTLPASVCTAPMRLRVGRAAFTLYPFQAPYVSATTAAAAAEDGEDRAGAEADALADQLDDELADDDEIGAGAAGAADADAADAAEAAAAAEPALPHGERAPTVAARIAANAAARKARWAEACKPRPCPFCPGAAGPTDFTPCHLFHECTHAAVAVRRAELRADASTLVADMLRILELAHERSHTSAADMAEFTAAADAVRELLRADQPARWDTPHGRFLLHHLLTVLPYREAVVTEVDGLAARLGRVFDTTTLARCHLHGLANRWAKWADRHIHAFAALRARLMRGLVPVPVPAATAARAAEGAARAR
jgi:hypothetical protein